MVTMQKRNMEDMKVTLLPDLPLLPERPKPIQDKEAIEAAKATMPNHRSEEQPD